MLDIGSCTCFTLLRELPTWTILGQDAPSSSSSGRLSSKNSCCLVVTAPHAEQQIVVSVQPPNSCVHDCNRHESASSFKSHFANSPASCCLLPRYSWRKMMMKKRRRKKKEERSKKKEEKRKKKKGQKQECSGATQAKIEKSALGQRRTAFRQDRVLLQLKLQK